MWLHLCCCCAIPHVCTLRHVGASQGLTVAINGGTVAGVGKGLGTSMGVDKKFCHAAVTALAASFHQLCGM